MILHGKDRELPVPKPFVRAVIEINVGDLDFRGVQGFRIERKPVVLRRDLDLTGAEILDRMVRAPMPEFELERFPPQRKPEQLMAEADSKDRFLVEKSPDVFDC